MSKSIKATKTKKATKLDKVEKVKIDTVKKKTKPNLSVNKTKKIIKSQKQTITPKPIKEKRKNPIKNTIKINKNKKVTPLKLNKTKPPIKESQSKPNNVKKEIAAINVKAVKKQNATKIEQKKLKNVKKTLIKEKDIKRKASEKNTISSIPKNLAKTKEPKFSLKKRNASLNKQTKLVKIPSLSTKNSKPYKPNYTTFTQNINEPDNSLIINRFSDDELLEFAKIINQKIEIAQNELVQYKSYISRKDEMGDDSESGRIFTFEDGQMGAERERINDLAHRQTKFIEQLRAALVRIENKTYGICRETGKLIAKERLIRVPHATLSVEGKTKIKH